MNLLGNLGLGNKRKIYRKQVVCVSVKHLCHGHSFNKSTPCRYQGSGVGTFSLKISSGKRGIIIAKMNLELSPLFVCISCLIMNIHVYTEFPVCMFDNGRDMTHFMHHDARL